MEEQAIKLVNEIVQFVGSEFTIDELIQFIESRRNKEIVFIELLVHHAYFGLSFAFSDFDLIITKPNLPMHGNYLNMSTMIHELLHLYRGDPKAYDITLDQFLGLGITAFDLTCHDATPNGKADVEALVQTAAMLLMEHITEVPNGIRRVYGS